MIKFFSPRELDSYLELELYHSLDCYKLRTSKKERPLNLDVKNFNPQAFLSLIEQFYDFLAELRYSIKLPIQNATYEDFVSTNYEDYLKEINLLILSIFHIFNKNDKRENVLDLNDINLLEALIIYHFYNCIEININKAIMKKKDATSIAIENRFIKSAANKLEVTDRNHYSRLLQNKLHRYGGNDRAGYWSKLIFSDEVISENIRNWFVNFLSVGTNIIHDEGKAFVIFSLLILTKYHLVLHRYAHGAYEFRTLSQHLTAEDVAIKGEIKKAQKVFTFTRLIAKYFPHIFVNNQEHSEAIAKTIEILSYIRRGSAYSSIDQMEKAFNDFTGAEKQLRSLREMQKKFKGNDIISFYYYDLILPYVFSLKGEIYRRNHAFYNAHQYYCNSISIYEDILLKSKIKTLQKTSLKIVRIKMANAKSIFELGQFRKSLKWYLKALEQLLKILKLTNDRNRIFDDLFNYLEDAHFDPKLSKSYLSNKLSKVTDELKTIVNKNDDTLCNYGILLSDLLTRISLIVFLLKIPDYDSHGIKELTIKYEKNILFKVRKNLKDKVSRNRLAWELLLLALRLNPGNSLAVFNNLAFGTEHISKEVNRNRNEIMEKQSERQIELMEFGGFRSIVYRQNAIKTLEDLRNTDETKKMQYIAKTLLQKLLLHTEDFSIKNAELHKYLMKDPHENVKKGDKKKIDPNVYFYVLQRWSSINPALPRPSAFKIKGGGYFIVFKGKGIAIDPGLNFVDNLYSEGFSIADIDYIIATHDHIDHTAEIDTILSLHYKRSKLKQESKKCINLLLNPSVSSRYNHILQQDPGLCRKIELTRDMNMPLEDFEGDLIIEPKKAIHPDLSSPNPHNSIGIVLVFYPKHKTKKAKIGIMSDTRYSDDIVDKYLDVDILIVHINSATFDELTKASGIEPPDVFSRMSTEKECKMKKEIEYSLGFIDKENNHMCLEGVVNAYNKFAYNNKQTKAKRLFVISEISEEMGSYRHKIAALLNQQSENTKIKCLTADIGMVMRINLSSFNKPTMHNQKIQVRCSRCNLNNDYTNNDKFHSPGNIKEFCIKREEEGIFYYCFRHDPEGLIRDNIEQYGFVERIERYQPFKHTDVYTL